MTKQPKYEIRAELGSVTIQASSGEKKGPPKFEVVAYTGGVLPGALRGSDGSRENVVIDLAGVEYRKSLVANLDHDEKKRVGNVTEVTNDGKQLIMAGVASASTQSRDEVVNSAADGFVWQASVEGPQPTKLEFVRAGQSAQANGQTFKGPVIIARKSRITGFAFVSHGADDNTTVSIAASAASIKEKAMKPECQKWIEARFPSINIEGLSAEEVANWEADFEGLQGKRGKSGIKAATTPFEDRKQEATRRIDIRAVADKFIDLRGGDACPLEDLESIEKLHDHAIEAKMTVQEFRNEMYESNVPLGHTVRPPANRRGPEFNGKVLEAAVCMAGGLGDYEKKFDDQTLQAAHTNFRNGIGLKQLFLLAAEANGYRGNFSGEVTTEVHNAAFGLTGGRLQANSGFSTLVLPTIISNTANLFLREGWNAIDMAPLQIAPVRSVRNFQTITTAAMSGNLNFEKVGATGEIPHGNLGETTYTNKADTYAKMLTISRQDIINDDLGALTAAPRKLGRGAATKLNEIFWTEFLALVGASFFASGNSNINTGVADMTVGGLDATEVIFKNQTDPDGLPLGIMPKTIVVPVALYNKAVTLMGAQGAVYSTSYATAAGDMNPFRGRFNIVSSPYIANSSYTGYTAVGWWMLADKNELPVIEIVALNGRVEPTVETADADFNVLGVSMRGYSDVGVKRQEYRGGVYADGGTS